MGIGTQKTTSVLFVSVGALASSFLPPGGGLERVHRFAIWLAGWIGSEGNYKLLFF